MPSESGKSNFFRVPGAGMTVRVSTSLRLPVTAHNRELLRWLRAAELSAWQAGKMFDGPIPSAMFEATRRVEPQSIGENL